MALSKLLSRNNLKPQKRRLVEVDEIDARLDVATTQFARAARRLSSQMRRDRTTVNVAAYRDRRAVALGTQVDPDVRMPEVRGGGFYQVELRRVPPMDRAEEFRMARRYEFLRLHLQLELESMGLGAAAAAELAGKARSGIYQALGSRRRSSYLERCIGQLEQLRNLYVEGALHVVLSTVARYRGLGVDAPDLIQEGNASLFQAIEGFDWRRDVRFRTYAQYWVQQAVLKMLYNSARTVRIPIWVQKVLGKIRRVQAEGQRAGIELTHAHIAERLGLTEEKVAWVLGTKRFAVSLDAERPGTDGHTLMDSLADEDAVPVPDSVPPGDLGRSLEAAMQDLPDRERMILRRRFGLGGGEPETLGDIASDLGITAERVRQLQNAALTRLQKPGKLRTLEAFVEQ